MVPVALGASLAWGASDFLAGLKTRRLALVWVLFVSQLTGLVPVLTAALVLGEPLPGRDAALFAAGAGVAELVGFAALYRALAIGTMSVVAPISERADGRAGSRHGARPGRCDAGLDRHRRERERPPRRRGRRPRSPPSTCSTSRPT